MTRAEIDVLAGYTPLLPPLCGAEHLCRTIRDMRFYTQTPMGLQAFQPSYISSWLESMGVSLLPMEFAVMESLSQTFINGIKEYDLKPDSAPPYTLEMAGITK